MFCPPIVAIFREYMRLADATSHYMDGDTMYTVLEYPSLMAFSMYFYLYFIS
jgi:hypothetical protein